jgi:hypothetical protein
MIAQDPRPPSQGGQNRHGGRRQGMEWMTALTAAVRLPGSNVREYVAAGTYAALGVVDLLSSPGTGAMPSSRCPCRGRVQVPNVHARRASRARTLAWSASW